MHNTQGFIPKTYCETNEPQAANTDKTSKNKAVFLKKFIISKLFVNFRRPLHAVNRCLFYYKTNPFPKSPAHSLKFKKVPTRYLAIRNNRWIFPKSEARIHICSGRSGMMGIFSILTCCKMHRIKISRTYFTPHPDTFSDDISTISYQKQDSAVQNRWNCGIIRPSSQKDFRSLNGFALVKLVRTE